MPNLYATLADVKTHLGIASNSTGDDSWLMALLEAASRGVDAWCKRHFYTVEATRYFDGPPRGSCEIFIDDVLAISALTQDTERDGTYDGETLTEGDDFYLAPANVWPKTQIIPTPDYVYSLRPGRRMVKAIGTWGYGDGESADPWQINTTLAAALDATATSVTLSDGHGIAAGHTIKIGSEQMYVSTISANTATVQRGVNGTTAAAHESAAAVSFALYPRMVIEAVKRLSARWHGQAGHEELSYEQIGSYAYRLRDSIDEDEMLLRLLGPYRRVTV